MTRLSKLSKKEVSEEVAALYDKVGAARGNIPNMFRILAHRPEILRTMTEHLNAVTTSGTVPTRTKELVASMVSRINRCEY